MEQLYAQALWQVIQKGESPREAVAKLRRVLGRHGREQLLPRIGRALKVLATRESARNAVTLTVARAKDEHAARNAVSEFLKETKASPSDVVVKTDDNLIGGWRLEGRERLVDASFKKHLLNLYNAVIQ